MAAIAASVSLPSTTHRCPSRAMSHGWRLWSTTCCHVGTVRPTRSLRRCLTRRRCSSGSLSTMSKTRRRASAIASAVRRPARASATGLNGVDDNRRADRQAAGHDLVGDDITHRPQRGAQLTASEDGCLDGVEPHERRFQVSGQPTRQRCLARSWSACENYEHPAILNDPRRNTISGSSPSTIDDRSTRAEGEAVDGWEAALRDRRRTRRQPYGREEALRDRGGPLPFGLRGGRRTPEPSVARALPERRHRQRGEDQREDDRPPDGRDLRML